MDFFEAQARAKKRTGRLVVLFALAVAGTILTGYLFAVLIVARGQIGNAAAFQPQLFAAVTVGTLAIVGIGAGIKWAQYREGGASVAEGLGAQRIEAGTTDVARKRLVNIVEEMAIASGLPVPAVYVLEDEPCINAFAAGLTSNDAIVCVTRGTIEKLNREELQGVIGHEFSHILNGDMRLNMRIGALIFGILVIGLAGRGILWSMGRGRVRVGRGKGGGQAIAVILVIGLAMLIVGYTGYFFGRLIQAAVSRQREFLADASAVQFTRNPAGIVNALRKIGGYAIGSAMESSKSEAIGHFFFAQAFGSSLSGLLATHPPLDERIKAIEPNFDGKYFEPPEVVDVESEPWARSGPAGNVAGFAPGALAHSSVPPLHHDPKAFIAAAGTVTTGQLLGAAVLLDALPAGLRDAAHSPTESPTVVYGLLLAADPALRIRQQAIVRERAGDAAASALLARDREFMEVGADARLPLLQLTLPALRLLPPDGLERFFDTLDELVHADESVSIFEYTLQKVLLHSLAAGRRPDANVIQIYSFNAVPREIAVVLSALARAGTDTEAAAQAAFAVGAEQIQMLSGQLAFLPPAESGLVPLDAALDRLATASLAIKQRVLVAAAETAGADGALHLEETELLRAVAATLDVPLPA